MPITTYRFRFIEVEQLSRIKDGTTGPRFQELRRQVPGEVSGNRIAVKWRFVRVTDVGFRASSAHCHTMSDFKDLKVWQKAHKMALDTRVEDS
jgi:hypothetical protein